MTKLKPWSGATSPAGSAVLAKSRLRRYSARLSAPAILLAAARPMDQADLRVLEAAGFAPRPPDFAAAGFSAVRVLAPDFCLAAGRSAPFALDLVLGSLREAPPEPS